MRAITVRKPPPLTTERIVGPVRQVSDWAVLAARAKELAEDAPKEELTTEELHVRFGEIFSKWMDEAEKELAECTYGGQALPKFGLRGKPPVMVWRSVLPERPRDEAKEDVHLVHWRSLANVALETLRLAMDAVHGPSADDGASGGHGDLDGDDHSAYDEDQVQERVHIAYEMGTLAEQLVHARHEVQETQREISQAAREVSGEHAVTSRLTIADRLVAMLTDIITGLELGSVHAAIIDEIVDLRGEIATELDAAAATVKARNAESWTRWLRDGIDAGARKPIGS